MTSVNQIMKCVFAMSFELQSVSLRRRAPADSRARLHRSGGGLIDYAPVYLFATFSDGSAAVREPRSLQLQDDRFQNECACHHLHDVEV